MLSSSKSRIGGIFGLVAVGAGIAVSQLLSSIKSGLNGPIVSIGNRVIDHVPGSVKAFVIRTFGVNDKRALVITISAGVFILGIIIGHLQFTGRKLQANLLVVAMTIAATLAAIFDANSGVLSVLPSLAAGGTTLWILRAFGSYAQEKESESLSVNRRKFLKTIGFIAAGSAAAVVAGDFLRTHTTAQLKRLNTVLPKALKFLPPPPTDPALTTPGLSKLFTPNAEFYRIDTALVVPNINVDTWKLKIDGMVKNPLEFSYKQLTERPTFELDDTIACVSNEVGGNLVGNARWLGIRLGDLIKEAVPLSSADQVMGHSVDGFTAGFPVAALDGRGAMIAIGMNGETLPLNHGFPARIIVPGLYGYVSATKWLTRIELTRFDKQAGYWIPRGWSALGPIKTAARIDTPVTGTTVIPGKRVIAGVAWAPTRGISKVEVRVNKDAWRPATLGPALAKTTWRQWWIDWDAASGPAIISVRATDGDGALQSNKEVPVEPNGAEGWHTIYLKVEK